MWLSALVLWWSCKGADCKEGFGKANDGLCYPIGTGDDDDTTGDDDDTTGDDDDTPTGDDDDTVLTAETGGPGDDDDDTVTAPDVVDDASLSVRCVGTEVTFAAAFLGEATEGMMDVFETSFQPGWNEYHTLPAVAIDTAGQFTELSSGGIPVGVAVSSWGDGIGSIFTCIDHYNPPVLTYVLRVYDDRGDLADCVAWGHDPDGVVAGDYSGNLYNEPVAPFEIATCRTLP